MNTRLRLLTIGHSYVVGVNRRLGHEMRRVAGDRWDIQIVAPSYFHGGKDLRPVTFRAEPGEPCPVAALPSYLTRYVHVFAYNWRQLYRVMRQGWDVIHAWEEPYILAGAELAAAAPRKSRFVFHTFQNLNKWYPPPFNLFERYVIRQSAGWICSGSLIPQVLNQRPGYDRLPHRVIPLGVDTGVFCPNPAARERVRKALDWEESGPPVVGFLGRFVPDKGILLLMTALDAVRSPWRALFVGAGPLEGELRVWAKRHGDRVRICTGVAHDQVPPHLNAMDVLAAPSQTTPHWREQFGRMLIEAMACGVAVAGSDSGEIPFVIGPAGLVLPEGDPQAWTREIGELVDSPQRRAELARAGLERARDAFNWSVVARQYLDFFEQLLNNKPSRGTS